MEVDGGCLCGQISYRGRIDPEKIAICHCSDCQVNSASAFGVVAHLEEFTLVSGTLRTWEKIADSGTRRALTFCGDCGTRIYAKSIDGDTGFWGLRIGTCHQRRVLRPKMQVWCDSRLPWVPVLQGTSDFARGPAGSTNEAS